MDHQLTEEMDLRCRATNKKVRIYFLSKNSLAYFTRTLLKTSSLTILYLRPREKVYVTQSCTVVEHMTHNPKMKGSVLTTGTVRKEMERELYFWCH